LELTKGGRVRLVNDKFRQQRKNSELIIKKEEMPKATFSLPYSGEDMKKHLDSSRFIRSDHPKIIETARKIVGDEKDPVKAAQLINHWVFKHLKKTPVASIPDAYTVLETARGDCNEHAVLAAALARAVGIPCKIALGLVFLEDSFYYHAWNAYWTGDTWVTADALMDQIPTDPTHVTLLYGDVDKHMNVLEYLGKLSFKVLEAK
jgi:transglutaminase-like putative cysteine protease